MDGQPELKILRVSEIILDDENPRFHHLRDKARAKLTETEMEHEIVENDEDLPLLTKAIQKSGVKDPIWVIRRGGKYVVIEGNRRVVVLRQLLKEKMEPPSGIKYDEVHANVMDPHTPDVEIILQKARLQAGKKAWGPYNEAALTYQLRERPYLMDVTDIAAHLKMPETKVKERIANYKLFQDYVKQTSDDNPKRFAYFSDCPPKVRQWFEDSSKNKSDYFKLISPTSGKFNKIRSVATRGGLREFAQVLDDPEALQLVLTDPHTGVEEALDIAKDNNITKGMPFIKKIQPLAMSLHSLDNEKLEKLKKELRFKTELKSLHHACGEVLKKLEK